MCVCVCAPACLHLQDTRLKWKTDVGKGKLTVKQTVPAGNWALVPNPSERAGPALALRGLLGTLLLLRKHLLERCACWVLQLGRPPWVRPRGRLWQQGGAAQLAAHSCRLRPPYLPVPLQPAAPRFLAACWVHVGTDWQPRLLPLPAAFELSRGGLLGGAAKFVASYDCLE